MRVLVTRPAEDGPRTAQLLAARGHQAILAPLFRVAALPHRLPDQAEAVFATSANALRMVDKAALARFAAAPLFAVGEATADAARACGFRDVMAAEGDSITLARLLLERLRPGTHLLQLAGRPRRDAALAALDGRFRIEVAETYETIACDTLPAAAQEALQRGSIDAVLHFSPRAARTFADLVADQGLMSAVQYIRHVYISQAARDPRLPAGTISQNPDLESVMNAL